MKREIGSKNWWFPGVAMGFGLPIRRTCPQTAQPQFECNWIQSQSYRRHTRAGSACHSLQDRFQGILLGLPSGIHHSLNGPAVLGTPPGHPPAPPEHNRNRDAAVLPASPRPAARLGGQDRVEAELLEDTVAGDNPKPTETEVPA